MISPTAVVLAVVFPLLLCLLMLLGTLLCRGRQRRAFDAIDLQRLHDKCAKFEKRLAAFPEAWDGNQRSGFSRGEVGDSFDAIQQRLGPYVQKWIDFDDPKNDSATRIEAVLFPEPPPKHALSTSKDTRVFPNPHQYTPAEICAFLEQTDTRAEISKYIMSSILLHAVSLEGDPFQTLLPFGASDMYGLDRLKTLIRGVDLSTNVCVHIGTFGFHYAYKGDTKPRFIALFESLFDPYYTMKSPADVAQHRLELRDVLDAAIQHGMKAVGQAFDKTEYRWGTRDDVALMISPALHALVYEDEKLKYDVEDISSSADNNSFQTEMESAINVGIETIKAINVLITNLRSTPDLVQRISSQSQQLSIMLGALHQDLQHDPAQNRKSIGGLREREQRESPLCVRRKISAWPEEGAFRAHARPGKMCASSIWGEGDAASATTRPSIISNAGAGDESSPVRADATRFRGGWLVKFQIG
ncbi:uncharacterized protein PAC_09380 [Phialocephala subalpina]|uniref:Uncharacterized protein n=1 Tax=Phialocephala subalpina TaxID=576137 RepID=A0A1L7X393_9HELO|nr:uncharacterized protein PAC_09380 [Phialocephala subalpina]